MDGHFTFAIGDLSTVPRELFHAQVELPALQNAELLLTMLLQASLDVLVLNEYNEYVAVSEPFDIINDLDFTSH